MTPTEQLYKRLDSAVAFFNAKLFNSELPCLLITVQRNQKGVAYFDPNRWGSSEGKNAHELAINSSSITSLSLLQLFTTLCQQMCVCWQYAEGSPSRRGYQNKELSEKMASIGLIPSSTGKPGGKPVGQNIGCYPAIDGPFLKAAIELIETDNWQMAWVDLEYKEKKNPGEHWLKEILGLGDQDISPEQLIASENPGCSAKAIAVLANAKTKDIVPPEQLRPAKSGLNKVASAPKLYKTTYSCQCGLKLWGKPGMKVLCQECYNPFRETPPRR